MSMRPFISVFEQIFDVAIFGAGYAGFAAAQTLARTGRSVVLIDPYGDVLWESGRCFVPEFGAGDAVRDPAMAELLKDLSARGGYDGRLLDGGMAEISATCMLKQSDMRALYYAYPVGVERAGNLIESVIVATKSGPRRVVARQFVDASEKGLLTQLAGVTVARREPDRGELYMYLLNSEWPETTAGAPTLWANQRVFTASMVENETTRQAVERVIQSLSVADQQAVLSHVSYEPYPIYSERMAGVKACGNLAIASPTCVSDTVATLADRYGLGLRAAHQLSDMPRAMPQADLLKAPLPVIAPMRELTCDVLVAGIGTGGVFAAIAAAEQGAKVIAVDPFTFPGGIGTGGGIHAYYYGVPGGMQDEVDSETRELMKQYGSVLVSHSFNPVAKMIVLEKRLARAGVTLQTHSMLCDANVENGRVSSVMVATEEGPVLVRASVYVDGTGDGDLCALAGAEFAMGRETDGVLHAYSQPTGGVHERDHNIRAGSRNLDSGWCDPSDSEDLTRARITGISHYQKDKPTADDRVTYVAPAIGLRQGRRIKTDYVVTLDDEVTGRFCDDVIGYAGSNYDAHTADYPMESDEGVFWVGLARSWYTGMVTPLPYRSLLPAGLRNVLIASRCLGMTQDAHYGLRMMRCMQRIGEAAGYAAADFAAQKRADLRQVCMPEIQKKLRSTGALLDDLSAIGQGWFKSACDEMASRSRDVPVAQDPRALRALEHLREGRADNYFWILMKNRREFESPVMEILRTASHPCARWFAAGIAAMWGSAEAEKVLIETIQRREFGYAHRGDASGPREQWDPLVTARFMPDWLTAVCLLRVCGSDRALATLEELVTSHRPTLLTAESVLLTLSRLLESRRVTDVARVREIVSRLKPADVTYTYLTPQATVTGFADIALRGWKENHPAPCDGAPPWPYCNTAEDHRWQFTLMLARVCRLIDLPLPSDLMEQLQSDRAIVRRALEKWCDISAVC